MNRRSQVGNSRASVRISGPTILIFMALMPVLPLCLQTAAASEAASARLIDPNMIMAGFQKGQQKVKVIVNLAEPAQVRAATNWNSRRSLQVLQARVLERQALVLSTLDNNEFKLRRRFENQAGFSTEVTFGGLNKLLNNPNVESIEPVRILEAHLAQGVALINGLAYRSMYNGQGMAIAICDTGIDYNHPKLGGGGFPNTKVIGGEDFGDDDLDPIPNGQAHGTCCAGIAAGDLGDTGDYIGGVAYGAKLYALKISFGTSGSAYTDDMVAAWEWCVTHKNDDPNNPIMVISTSFGGDQRFSSCDGDVPSMTTAAENAVAAGITVLASAGNDGYCDSIEWPACISSVISVGAVYDTNFGEYYPCISNQSCATKFYTPSGCLPYSTSYAIDETAADMVTSYSDTASFLDILAPSNQAYTTDIEGSGGYSSGDYYDSFGGTSAACPYAAGAVASLQSAAKAITGSYLTPAEIRDKLAMTGDPVTDGKVAITKPRVNLGQAITSFTGAPPVAYDSTASAAPRIVNTIALQAADIDGGLPDPPGALTYIIESLPSYGKLADPCAEEIEPNNLPYALTGYGSEVYYATDSNCFLGTDSFDFKVNDGGNEPNGGDSNTATVTIEVQNLPVVIYQTDFEGGLPAGWSIVDGGSDGKTWTSDNPGGRSNSNWTGTFMIVDSDWAGRKTMDEELITHSIDCSDSANVTLRFKHYFDYWYLGRAEKGDVDVRVNGGEWQNMIRLEGGDVEGIMELDLSSFGVDGSSDVQVRWHYYNARYDYWWGIDDVEILSSMPLEYPAGDFEPDCDVDLNDYAFLASVWQTDPNATNWNPVYDISEPNDNIINADDLSVLADNWLVSRFATGGP